MLHKCFQSIYRNFVEIYKISRRSYERCAIIKFPGGAFRVIMKVLLRFKLITLLGRSSKLFAPVSKGFASRLYINGVLFYGIYSVSPLFQTI